MKRSKKSRTLRKCNLKELRPRLILRAKRLKRLIGKEWEEVSKHV